MIEFRKVNNDVILHYTSENQSVEWIYHELDKSGHVPIAKAFKLTNKELITPISDTSQMSVDFKVAEVKDDYYCFPNSILSIEHDLYIHQDIKLERKVFVAERGISVFAKLAKISDDAIFIGGNIENAIPESVFQNLLASFPNTYELNHYASARISAIVSSYINTKEDYEERYQKYLNKKVSKKGSNLKLQFTDIEILKYTSLLEKLQTMLDDEGAYTEAQWQEELLQIILLLYPKYIHVFKEAPVRDTYNNSNRNIDYLLVDSSGNTDIIEIKKPFDKCIVTKRTYRDNYIPLRELSGTVMQIEKYIFYLNKWGKKGEEKLTETYKTALPDNFEIKITNPSGIIIMGRKKGLSDAQLQDFEVIKRKYKNVIDIITYDDLIERLEFTLKQWTTTKAISTK